MSKDFIEPGDVFNHEGRLYYVVGIPTPRTLALSKVNGSGRMPTHLFTITGSSSIYWGDRTHVWEARGGTLEVEGVR